MLLLVLTELVFGGVVYDIHLPDHSFDTSHNGHHTTPFQHDTPYTRHFFLYRFLSIWRVKQ